MNPLSSQLDTPNGVGTHIWRPEVALGDAGTHNLWTITAGPLLILALWGIVKTTLMDGVASTLRIEHALGNTNLCGDLAAIADDPVGTAYYLVGVQASLMLKAEPAAAGMPDIAVANLTPIPCVLGDIEVVNSGNQTGVVEWHMVYVALDPLTVVVNAAAY